ncbi:MAG TPA: amidohydrolase family protein [Candidatus Binatia bacterium]|nr:amidohydrolase family protein [Candidatus Binatia bacterium]
MKRIIGAGVVAFALIGGCTAHQPQVPPPPPLALQASTTLHQAEAAAQRADAAAARAEAGAARAEQTSQRVEVATENLAGRMTEAFGEQEVRNLKKISTHEHYRAGGDIKPYLAVMARANIEKAIFLPTDWPPSNPHARENLKELLALKRRYPERIVVFATAYDKDPAAAEVIEQALKDGAQGIKFIDWLASATYPDDAGPVDSPNMLGVYEIARRYQAPVLLHIDFQKRPDWKQQFDRVAAAFPTVTFILAHYCRAASGEKPELTLCADTLDRFPNVAVDLSMGGGLKRYMRYFDDAPELWRAFVLRYQDRILWGTDLILDDNPGKNADWIWRRMLTDFSMLQTVTYQSPFHQDDKSLHQGLALPAAVLRKIYYDNPQRLLFTAKRPSPSR